MSQIMNNIGSLMISGGDIAGAQPYLLRALDIVRGTRFRGAEAQALVKLGIIEGMKGRFEDAVAKFKAALEIQEGAGDRREQGVILNNVGNKCLMEMGDYDGAKRVLRQALLIHRETGNQINEANSLENLGCIFLRDGDLNRARLHLEDSLRLFESVRFPYGRISSRASLGMVEAEAGALESAVSHYRAAREVTEEMKVASTAAEALKDLRDLLIRKGVPDASLPLPRGWLQV